MNKQSLQRSITRLKAVIRDPNCTKMNKSTVVGYLGEVVVREKLISEGLEVDHLGNQTGYDLHIRGSHKIDVKACTVRPEFGENIDFWGWALLNKSKQRKLSFEYIICVAFSRELDVDSFYVIKTDRLKHFPPSPSRFKNVIRSFNVFDAVPELPRKSRWFAVRKTCEKAIKGLHVKRISPSERLSDALR